MSGYDGAESFHNDDGYSNEYINFNQFLMQHNFGTTQSPQAQVQSQHFTNTLPSPYVNIATPYPPNRFPFESNSNASNAYDMHNGYYQPPSTDFTFDSNVVQNSNLMVTASEFVPSTTFATSTSPRNTTTLDAAAIPFTNDGLASNKDSPKVSADQNALLQALQNTQINDLSPSSPAVSLTSSGGAVRKVKSGHAREGNQRNNNNSYNNSYAGYSPKYQPNANSNDRRRDGRKGDNNSRRHGSGRTASQYDTADRYNHANEYYNERYKDRPNDNGNQEVLRNAHTKPSREKRHNNQSSKRIDEFKSNRNTSNKSVPPKVKIDTTNYSQREKLTREIDSGRLECLVCCEVIKPFHSIWSCNNCYHIIHLKCVIQWAASSKSEEGWRCCACQNITKTVPHEYFCFCGKLKNPQYNRNDVAHSCGDCCGRADSCAHPCTQLCHPGPCPPCQATVTRKCGCGRSERMMQCCQKDDLECDVQCDKELNCGAHRCEQKCHGGLCGDCKKEIEHKCHCGREMKMLMCTEEDNVSLNYSCGTVCDKALKCGNHRCQRVCHVGECNECQLLPTAVKTCPCGKMTLTPEQRTSCTDPIPLCVASCRKPLTCGQPAHPHVCQAKCHEGPCPPCNKQTSVKCRCGNMDQMMKCIDLSTRADDARCKKRCTKKRSCGKHKCNELCCIDIDHVCPQACTYSLSCGKHKCDQTCHKGRCLPCYRSSFDELQCECGANVIYPPVPCGTKRPACDKPCSRTHACDHSITHNCHSAQTCPPCMAFTTKYCYGKHEQRKIIPCSQESFSCGLACHKPLKCGQHKCKRPCHSGPCESETEVCKQKCTKKTRIMCPHNCNAPCHLDTPCPETPCRELVEVLCQCGLRKQQRTCQDFSTEYRKIATSKLASSVEQMQNGGMVELSDVLGPLKMTNNKTLECTEECRVHERNRRLAIGLQIRNPDLPSKLQPKYSEFIRGWAKKDPKLVILIHDKLTELVKLAKESPQRSRSHSFPIMNREKRQLVHELCAMFGVVSVAYDAEPNRNIVATAQRDTSWLPGMSVMETIQRESGQRRIPVPSLNAWGLKR